MSANSGFGPPTLRHGATSTRSRTSQQVRVFDDWQERSRGSGPEPRSASRLATRLELLRNTLRPTPHVPLAMEGMNLVAKLEYVNPVGSIKDRAAYWILKRAAERGEICDETTVIESSCGNFAAALAAFTRLVGLQTLVGGSARSFLSSLPPWWLLALALGTATPVWAQAPGTWARIADLNKARAEHTATLLPNGTVLIAGGKDVAGQPLTSAEIYNPVTGVYTVVSSPLPTPVWGHTATGLNDGTVLLAGGTGDGGLPVTAAVLDDPATDPFAALDPLSTPRARHTATLLRDGKVLIAGGTDGPNALASLEVYDPPTRTFSLAPSALLTPR